MRAFIQQGLGGENLRRGAVAALNRAVFDEGFLQRVQAVGFAPALVGVFAERFQRGDFVTLGLRRQHQPGVDRFPIQQNGIRAGKSVFVAKFNRLKAKLPHGGQQRCVRGIIMGVVDAINRQCDIHKNS